MDTHWFINSTAFNSVMDKQRQVSIGYLQCHISKEYHNHYPQENMIYKGCFLDLAYDRMMDRAFNYYILTHDIVEFLDKKKFE